jgi:phosphoglycolate phosphatase
MTGTIRGILFDKDGTLIDFDATWFSVGEAMALRAADGDPARARTLLEAVGCDLGARRFKADSIFAAGTNADIVAAWYPDLPAGARAAKLAEFDAFSVVCGSQRPVPLEGVSDAVRTLHASGLRLGIATNDSTAGAEGTVVALGIAQHFDAIYGYDAVASPKPAPDTVQAFCDLTGLKPREVAVVGDNRHDLEMGRAGGAGLTVGVLSGTGTRERLAPLADVVLESVADLPAFLRERG